MEGKSGHQEEEIKRPQNAMRQSDRHTTDVPAPYSTAESYQHDVNEDKRQRDRIATTNDDQDPERTVEKEDARRYDKGLPRTTDDIANATTIDATIDIALFGSINHHPKSRPHVVSQSDFLDSHITTTTGMENKRVVAPTQWSGNPDTLASQRELGAALHPLGGLPSRRQYPIAETPGLGFVNEPHTLHDASDIPRSTYLLGWDLPQPDHTESHAERFAQEALRSCVSQRSNVSSSETVIGLPCETPKGSSYDALVEMNGKDGRGTPNQVNLFGYTEKPSAQSALESLDPQFMLPQERKAYDYAAREKNQLLPRYLYHQDASRDKLSALARRKVYHKSTPRFDASTLKMNDLTSIGYSMEATPRSYQGSALERSPSSHSSSRNMNFSFPKIASLETNSMLTPNTSYIFAEDEDHALLNLKPPPMSNGCVSELAGKQRNDCFPHYASQHLGHNQKHSNSQPDLSRTTPPLPSFSTDLLTPSSPYIDSSLFQQPFSQHDQGVPFSHVPFVGDTPHVHSDSNPQRVPPTLDPLHDKYPTLPFQQLQPHVTQASQGVIRVENVPSAWTFNDFYNIFSPYGRILEYSLNTKPNSQKKGVNGWVMYDSPDSSIRAYRSLNDVAVHRNCVLKIYVKEPLTPKTTYIVPVQQLFPRYDTQKDVTDASDAMNSKRELWSAPPSEQPQDAMYWYPPDLSTSGLLKDDHQTFPESCGPSSVPLMMSENSVKTDPQLRQPYTAVASERNTLHDSRDTMEVNVPYLTPVSGHGLPHDSTEAVRNFLIEILKNDNTYNPIPETTKYMDASHHPVPEFNHFKLNNQVPSNERFTSICHDTERDKKDTNDLRESSEVLQQNNLFVFHIPPGWKESDFRRVFSQFGPIRCLHFPKDDNTPWGHRGYAFVCYEHRADACLAIQEMHGKEVEYGRRLKVEFKKPSNSKHRNQKSEHGSNRPPLDKSLNWPMILNSMYQTVLQRNEPDYPQRLKCSVRPSQSNGYLGNPSCPSSTVP